MIKLAVGCDPNNIVLRVFISVDEALLRGFGEADHFYGGSGRFKDVLNYFGLKFFCKTSATTPNQNMAAAKTECNT